MTQPHFLLADWLQWAQGAVAFVQGGGLQLLNDASGSFDPGRDAGNAATGAGGGALTGDAFKRLTGFDVPANEAPDGFNRIRDVFSDWLGNVAGDGGSGPDAGGAETPGTKPPPVHHFPLEDFVDGGAGGQTTPPPGPTKLEDVLPDDFK